MAGHLDARAAIPPVPGPAPGAAARPRARRRIAERRFGERGAALVEMALVLPLLMMIVFGVIEFGTTYSNYLGLRDGVRNAARSGAVGNTGSSATCDLVGAGEASPSVRALMCRTKDQIGLDPTQVRVKIISANSTFSGAGTFAKNDALVVCAQVKTSAVTGFLGTALTGKFLRTKVAMRIELSDFGATDPDGPTAGDEDPPTGGNWTWCSYQALAV